MMMMMMKQAVDRSDGQMSSTCFGVSLRTSYFILTLESWILLHATRPVTLVNFAYTWRGIAILILINVSSISSVWWYTGVSVDALPSSWRRTVFRSVRHQLAVPSHLLGTYGRRPGFRNCRPDHVELAANTLSSCGERHRCIWTIT